MYKKAEASFWTAEEIDLSKDLADWETLVLLPLRRIANVCRAKMSISLFPAFWLSLLHLMVSSMRTWLKDSVKKSKYLKLAAFMGFRL